MSVETKVLPASTRTNLEVLKHHMKKLGFKYYEEDRPEGWVDFGAQLMSDGDRVSPLNCISISIHFLDFQFDLADLDLISRLPEVKQAVLDFYKAEGITDED